MRMERDAHQCQISRRLPEDTIPGSWLEKSSRNVEWGLTGSTANFVTASSPVSFKQTFPSGLLQEVSVNVPQHLIIAEITAQEIMRLTVYLLGHSVLTLEAWKLLV